MFSTILITALIAQLVMILLSRLLNFFKPMILLTAISCIGLTVWKLVLRSLESSFAPLYSKYNCLILLVLILEILVLFMTIKKKVSFSILSIISFCTLLLAVFSSTPFVQQTASVPAPVLHNPLLFFHVIPAFLGLAFFTLAFAASVIQIFATSSNRAEFCSGLAYRSVLIGFPLYSIGALIFGAIWGQLAWGSWWNWDPKEIWALITWLVFTLYLHQRYIGKKQEKFLAWLLVGGFLLSIFTFLGTSYLYPTMHNFL